MRDLADFGTTNEVYKEFFGDTGLPARTTLPVPLHGFDIEVDAVLYIGA